MLFPEIAIALSLLFGIHVLTFSFLSRPIPVMSMLLHLFGFLIGFILITTSGDTWQNTVLSLSSASLILAFLGGFFFLLEEVVSFNPPSKLLGIGYMTFLTIGFVLLLI